MELVVSTRALIGDQDKKPINKSRMTNKGSGEPWIRFNQKRWPASLEGCAPAVACTESGRGGMVDRVDATWTCEAATGKALVAELMRELRDRHVGSPRLSVLLIGRARCFRPTSCLTCRLTAAGTGERGHVRNQVNARPFRSRPTGVCAV
jgi:hypothetical protein